MEGLDRAFTRIDRGNYLPETERGWKSIDAPIAIGYGQTNSQPSTVYRMLGWLNPEEGNKVLDVGAGSGWTTALLSYLVGSTGFVYAVERVPELVKFGKTNCKKAGIKNVLFQKAAKIYGLPKHAPYDRILVSAYADETPKELLDQLVIGGRMVIPVRGNIQVIYKLGEEKFEISRHPGYVFVPLVR